MSRIELSDRVLGMARYAPLMFVPCLLLASTYPGQYRVPAWYWGLAMGSALVFAAGRRWPTVASLSLAVLAVPMFAADAWGLSALVPYLGAVAVVDVAMRAARAGMIAVAAAGWCAAVLAGVWLDAHEALASIATAVKVLAYVGLPLLLGLYLRAQRELAATYRERAREAESSREEAERHTRAAERSALARELHDLVAHHMASIVLRIGVAQHVLPPQDDAVREVLAEVRDTAADALADIRRLLVALRDPALGEVALGEVALVEPGAVAAEIDAAAARVRAAGFEVCLDMGADEQGVGNRGIGDLDAIGRLTLLRVVQESLKNAMRHGDRGGPVSVVVRRSGECVEVRVRNSGVGSGHSAGHGLIGMRERVHLVGGWVEIGPDDGGRWEVHVRIPLGVRQSDTAWAGGGM